MWTDSVLAAVVSGVVGLAVAWLAHRRSTAAVAAEQATSADAAANEQVKVITQAYEQVLEQLRHEIDRLIEARMQDRARWELREDEMQRRIDELEARLAGEIAERERLQARVDALDPAHPHEGDET